MVPIVCLWNERWYFIHGVDTVEYICPSVWVDKLFSVDINMNEFCANCNSYEQEQIDHDIIDINYIKAHYGQGNYTYNISDIKFTQ
jgi:hypothetical protein